MIEYPNLPLLEEKFKSNLTVDGYLTYNRYGKCVFEVLGVFLQHWANTAGLFEDGGMSGQAMSAYYTTVMKLTVDDKLYSAVFQGNNLVYVIYGLPETLIEDVNNHDVKCFRIAKDRYVGKKER